MDVEELEKITVEVDALETVWHVVTNPDAQLAELGSETPVTQQIHPTSMLAPWSITEHKI